MSEQQVVSPERKPFWVGLRGATQSWLAGNLSVPVRRAYGRTARAVPSFLKTRIKHRRELGYWKSRFVQPSESMRAACQETNDAYYQRLMLSIAGEQDPSFLRDKIVADFGCGPLGSLCWAKVARVCIGIDVLADSYAGLDIASHDMCYVTSTESTIPLPSNYVDVLYTANALDHVANLQRMCDELLRILARGGELIASLNLGESATVCEPQMLSEKRIDKYLLRHLEVRSYRIAPRAEPPDCPYRHFFDPGAAGTTGSRYLWVRARKAA